jgi:hypothetical protein
MKRMVAALLATLCVLVPSVGATATHESSADGLSLKYVYLGSYPFAADGAKKPVLWRVLDDHFERELRSKQSDPKGQNGQVLLLQSAYILDVYPVSWEENARATPKSLRRTDVYKWLNGLENDTVATSAESEALAQKTPMVQAMFTEEERALLKTEFSDTQEDRIMLKKAILSAEEQNMLEDLFSVEKRDRFPVPAAEKKLLRKMFSDADWFKIYKKEEDVFAAKQDMLRRLFTEEELNDRKIYWGPLFPINRDSHFFSAYGFSTAYDVSPTRESRPTPYSKKQGLFVESGTGAGGYWVNRVRDGMKYWIQIVGYDGHLSWSEPTRKNMGVRPAVCLSLDQWTIAGGTGKADSPYVLRPRSTPVPEPTATPTLKPTATPTPQPLPAPRPTVTPNPDADTLVISLIGDCGLGDTVQSRSASDSFTQTVAQKGYAWPFSTVRSYLEAGDYRPFELIDEADRTALFRKLQKVRLKLGDVLNLPESFVETGIARFEHGVWTEEGAR